MAAVTELVNEFNMGKYLSNSMVNYFVKPYAMFRTKFNYIVVMELVKGIELFEIAQVGTPKGLTKEKIQSIIFQLVDAVEKMHQCGVYHRDIKPENIMYDENKDLLKIVDYGMSCTIDEDKSFDQISEDQIASCEPKKLCGTSGFLSNLELDDEYPEIRDIWPTILSILFLWFENFDPDFEQARQGADVASPQILLNAMIRHFVNNYGDVPENSIKKVREFQEYYGSNMKKVKNKFLSIGKIDKFFWSLFEYLYSFFITYIILYTDADIESFQRDINKIEKDLNRLHDSSPHGDLNNRRYDPRDEEEAENVIRELKYEITLAEEVIKAFNKRYKKQTVKFETTKIFLHELRVKLASLIGKVVNDDECAVPARLLSPENIPFVNFDDLFLCIKKPIGTGGFGTVRKCIMTETGRQMCGVLGDRVKTRYAVKFIKIANRKRKRK